MIVEWVSDGQKKVCRFEDGAVKRFSYRVTQQQHTRRGLITIGKWHTLPEIEANNSSEKWQLALKWYNQKA